MRVRSQSFMLSRVLFFRHRDGVCSVVSALLTSAHCSYSDFRRSLRDGLCIPSPLSFIV